MVVPLLPLMCGSNCWEVVDPVLFIEFFRKHAVEIGQILLALICGCF